MKAISVESEVLRRLKFAVAAELAAAGAYHRAESLLAGATPSPEELDLLARIHVQQERYKAARECWERAASKRPDEPSYKLALQVLEEHLQRVLLHARLTRALYLLMLALGVLALALLLLAGRLD